MHDHLVGEPIRLTYQDYCALPDDGRRYQILDGAAVSSPTPFLVHQRVLLNLAMGLREHIRRLGLGEAVHGPIDVLLSEHDIVVPDLVYVSSARKAIIEEAYVNGAPDLIVEVLSPTTVDRDLRDKRNIYARCGVDWYWIVDPDGGTLLELQRVDAAYAETARVAKGAVFSPRLFAGWTVEMKALWE